MTTANDEATVLCRMALPLVQLAQDKECTIQLRVTETLFKLGITERTDEKNKEFFEYYRCFGSSNNDWNMQEEEGSRYHTCFRTFDSMKEILWTIREALE